MADLIPVTFNEGEPLDVNKLNNIRLNQVTTYEMASSLQNATIDGKTFPKIDFGSVNVVTKVGSSVAVNLPISASFTGAATFIVSIGGGSIKDAIAIPRVINGSTPNPQVIINSNKAVGTIVVNYIAIQSQ